MQCAANMRSHFESSRMRVAMREPDVRPLLVPSLRESLTRRSRTGCREEESARDEDDG